MTGGGFGPCGTGDSDLRDVPIGSRLRMNRRFGLGRQIQRRGRLGGRRDLPDDSLRSVDDARVYDELTRLKLQVAETQQSLDKIVKQIERVSRDED